MTHKVGPKGQVVIPKHIRDALGIEPGDRVDFAFDGIAVTIEPVRPTRSLMGILAGGPSMTAALEQERRRERSRDAARSGVPA